MKMRWYQVHEASLQQGSNTIWTLAIAFLATLPVIGLAVPHPAAAQADNPSRIQAGQHTPPAIGKSIELKYDGKTIQVDPKTPLPVIESLQKQQADKQPGNIEKFLNGLCSGGKVKCTGNEPVEMLEAQASTELLARKQLDSLGKKFSAPELLKIFGQEVGADEVVALSGAVWTPAMSQKDSALLDNWRKLPPGTIEKLLAGMNTQQQTAPGTGVDGTQTLPGNIRNSVSNSLPLLPMPLVVSPLGGATPSCASQPIALLSVLNPVEFAKKYASAQADRPIVFCRDGFSDVLLIDSDGAGGVCTGVRVALRWVLTAGHCVKDWTNSIGRIFQTTPTSMKCLEGSLKAAGHPADACGLTALQREVFPMPGAGSDLALIRIPEDTSGRLATIVTFDADKPFELTLAGFGQTLGAPAGRLRVGWSDIHDKMALAAIRKGTDPGSSVGPFITIMRDVKGGALQSWSCPGDSGAPFFAGRVFGWSNEPHNVFAINVAGTAAEEGCKPQVSKDTKTKFVFLHQASVRKWMCETTDNEIDICR